MVILRFLFFSTSLIFLPARRKVSGHQSGWPVFLYKRLWRALSCWLFDHLFQRAPNGDFLNIVVKFVVIAVDDIFELARSFLQKQLRHFAMDIQCAFIIGTVKAEGAVNRS
jgi:hypothetical protein